uniref:Uncharacterized protein n=1 Tax=Trichuris muris TaxID=70415 RepID=A0A5S6R1F5_TRIMR
MLILAWDSLGAWLLRISGNLWVRLATVIGYICSVCLPAVALSIYYVGFWDPQYKEKFPPNTTFMSSVNGVQSSIRRTVDSSAEEVDMDKELENSLPESRFKSSITKEEPQRHQGNFRSLSADKLRKEIDGGERLL